MKKILNAFSIFELYDDIIFIKSDRTLNNTTTAHADQGRIRWAL